MKQSEKSLMTKNRIIQAAIEEFGTFPYDTASINNICIKHKISKGLIYHNFKNKDELYLICIKECLDSMNENFFINNKSSDIKIYISDFFNKRKDFFIENPFYSFIFFSAILHPPRHLSIEISNIKKDFDINSRNYFKKALDNIELRSNVSKEDALEYFSMIQEMYNIYFQKHLYDHNDLNSSVQKHEIQVEKFFDIMLYGITKEEKIVS